MSQFGLVPFFPRWFDVLDRSHSLFDQFFGHHLLDEDLVPPPMLPPAYYARPHHGRHRHNASMSPEGQLAPFRHTFDRNRSGLSRVVNSKDQFKVSLDVHQFKPEEVVVKTIDNFVVIEGRHEEKEDEHGYIQRHFVRKYLLPEGVKPENVTSVLSSDGVLTVAAPKQSALGPGGERLVPIAHVPYPAINAGAAAAAPKVPDAPKTDEAGDKKAEKMEN